MVAALSWGCAGAPPVPTATATRTPSLRPTATATGTRPATPTLAAFSNAPTVAVTPSATPISRQHDQLPTPIPPSPTATPAGIACQVSANSTLNLREGPGENYQIIATLPPQSSVIAHKQVTDAPWLLVSAVETLGWVYQPLIRCQGNPGQLPVAGGVVVSQPTPRPVAATATTTATVLAAAPAITPTVSIPVGRWHGEYYANASLLGQPVLVREDADLNFNWFLDSPGPGIPADNFSARWTGQFNFPSGGDYRFFANADDGVRVYVDGGRVIDSWETEFSGDRTGTFANLTPGLHTITVEYFESGGYARIRVWADTTTLTSSTWAGEYFANRDLQNPPAFSRDSGNIDFNWGNNSPDDSLLNPDFFSVRWKRTLHMDYGTYKFYVEMQRDDWVRVTIDGWKVIEKYQEDADDRFEREFANMGGGNVTIVVEFKDYGGRAKIKFWWDKQ